MEPSPLSVYYPQELNDNLIPSVSSPPSPLAIVPPVNFFDTPSPSVSSRQDCRQKKPFPFDNEIPDFMLPWIEDWLNVIGDGNCGYRALAHQIYGNESEWVRVRRDLLDELTTNKAHYTKIFGRQKEVDLAAHSISHWSGPAPKYHWMSILDMGFIIANRYDAIFVNLSLDGSVTFLPTKPSCSAEICLAVVYVASMEHFVWVRLGNESPLPRLYTLWKHNVDDKSSHLRREIEDRLKKFAKHQPRQKSSTNSSTKVVELDNLE
ncbi:hypothetical protein RND81_02G209100 [Saponaria officinalis]|uniref:OTU domain-containing protein n=1 Tax=Saponaria officinalis TaxID=3572 RepID=A0AAW1MWJ4_SAPOF